MTVSSATTDKSITFSLTRLLLYVCFVVFPFIMLFVELERFFYIEMAARRAELHERAEKQLLRFSEYAEDSRFFHLLLKQSFPDHTPHSKGQLQATAASLKKSFPGVFTFIFWDKNGNVITSLSDEKRFGFLLKKLQVLLNGIRHDTIAGRHTESGFSKKFEKELRLLRQFLGPFVIPEELTMPFLTNNRAACFELHGRGNRVLGWYSELQDHSVLAFISDRIKGELSGPRLLNRQMAGRVPGIEFWLLDEQSMTCYPKPSDRLQSQMLLNFGRYRQLATGEQLESENSYFGFKKLNQRWWAAAVISKSHLDRFSHLAGRFLAKLLAALTITSFIIFCYFLVHENPLHSVRARLVLIFAYIIFIPALVFTVVGIDYIKQRERQIFNDRAVQSSRLLTSIDDQFSRFLHEKSTRLNQLFEAFSDRHATPSELASLAALLNHDFKPDTITISDRSGADILNGLYSNSLKDDFLRKTAAEEMLTYLNCSSKELYRPDDGVANGFALGFKSNHRKFLPFILNNATYLSYLNTLKNPGSQSFEYLIQVFWYEWQLHEEFFRQMAQLDSGTDRRLHAYFPDSGKVFPSLSASPEMQTFFEKIRQNGPSQQLISDCNGQSFLIFGQPGRQLNTAILAVKFPAGPLFHEIGSLKNGLLLLAGLSLLMTLSLYHLLGYYLITPIKSLATGVEMVKMRNYKHRIQLSSGNEFSRLGQSINQSLENLQQLEIAKTVQESLLPQDALSCQRFSVHARTSTMTTLGGDYYDYVADKEGNATILMADVAGHGVQAALLMAMAKSVLLLHNASRIIPEAVMDALNRTFFTLRKSEISTMMTGQIIYITSDGLISLFNAGHCPPIVINKRQTTPIENQTLPFGFSLNRKHSGVKIEIASGDIIVLYSDGILECTDKTGEVLGIDGFRELLQNCFDADPERFIDNLFAAYENRVESQQDDITFVMIKAKET